MVPLIDLLLMLHNKHLLLIPLFPVTSPPHPAPPKLYSDAHAYDFNHSSFSRQDNVLAPGSSYKDTDMSHHWTRIIIVHGILNGGTGPKSLRKTIELCFQPVWAVLGTTALQLHCLSNALPACSRAMVSEVFLSVLHNFSFHFQLILLAKPGNVCF